MIELRLPYPVLVHLIFHSDDFFPQDNTKIFLATDKAGEIY